MTVLESIILAIVQGITEFIPVSSSGHLVLTRHILGAYEGLLTFEVFVHLGTAFAVLFVFHGDVKKLIFSKEKEYRHFLLMLILALIPTGVLGIFFEDFVEGLFASTLAVGIMLSVTGLILFISYYFTRGKKQITDITIADALLIGFAQGLAIIPGISRSGITIVTALTRNLERNTAARFSFVLSLPTILGAGLIHSRVLFNGELELSYAVLFWGTLVSFLAGYLAIKVLLNLIRRGKIHYFAYYCWAVSIFILIRHFI